MTPIRSAGFTLPELLVAVAVGGLVGGALISLLLGQGRFYRHADDSVQARQSAGAISDLMSSELRLTRAADFIAAEPESLSVRVDVVLGVVCDSIAPDQVALFWYDSIPALNLPAGISGTSFSPPLASGTRHADGWAPVRITSGMGAKSVCVANGATSAAPDADYWLTSGWAGAFAGEVPARGSLVRRYATLTYRIAASSFGAGDALWRNRQEIVAPLGVGASFSYERDDGSVTGSIVPSELWRLREIRLDGQAEGLSTDITGASRQLGIAISLLR